MDYIINFLSLLIIWSIIYYYINNYDIYSNTETFIDDDHNTENELCNFEPWGLTVGACEARCFVSGKTLTHSDIGSGCSKEKCYEICSKCTDAKICNWLDPPTIITDTETTDNIICIPGNKKIIVYFYYKPIKTGFFVLQYYKSRYPHEGIHIKKVLPYDTKQYYKISLDKNIENDFEYSVSFYHANTDKDIITNKVLDSSITLKSDNLSKVVRVVPSKFNTIILP